MKTSEVLFFLCFGAVVALGLTTSLQDWLRKRRITAALARRVQRDDSQFLGFFPDPKRADIAIRARRVLSNNLKLPLDGLTPGDRLNEDLNAELPANPDFFWELEAEFGIKTNVEELDSHEKNLDRLVTFQDLVEYIERKLSEPLPQTTGADEDERPSRAYDLAIRSIPILCIGGFLTAVASIVLQKKSLINVGGLIFMSGIAVWGFANGGELLRNMIRAVRGLSFKELAAHPWRLIVLTSLVLFLLWVGCVVFEGILKNVLSSR